LIKRGNWGKVSKCPVKGTFLTLEVIFTEFVSKHPCRHPDALQFFFRNKLVVVFLSVHPLSSFADSELVPLSGV
jgi:hypothetical protein